MHRPIYIVARTALAMLLALCCLQAPAARADGVAVVVNPGVEEQRVSLGTLRTIFGMRLRTWEDGTPIRVYVLPDDHPLHSEFTKQVLGMFPHQLRWAWDRLVFSGTGQAPTEVGTEREMYRKIAGTAGAIGYLRRDQIDEDIKVLRVE
jgi:ABC-type phosphate transport system substrate-binding protein